MQCDFCTSDDVAKVFPARDEEMPEVLEDGLRHISTGGWSACQECAGLIETNDRAGLLDRAAHLFKQKWGFQHRGVLASVHETFWRSRIL